MENDDLKYLVELSEAQEFAEPAEPIAIENYVDHLAHKQHRE